MAAFLEAHQLERFAQRRIVDRACVTQDAQARATFGLHGDVPDRQPDQPFPCFRVQLGPVDHRRFVRIDVSSIMRDSIARWLSSPCRMWRLDAKRQLRAA